MLTPPFSVDAVLFDLDGTLTAQGAIDFDGIRRAIGVPEDTEDVFILEYMDGLDPAARAAAEEVVVRMEMEAASRSEPNAGAEAAVAVVKEAGLPVGIITRNARASVETALARFPSLRYEDFDVVVTRDDELPVKPAPDMLLHAASVMGVSIKRVMMVGDFRLDVEAGVAAGAITVYLREGEDDGHPDADVVIDSLVEFPRLLAARRD